MDKASVARFFGLIVAMLAYFNINVPGDVVEGLTMVIVGGWAIYAAWKNNNISKKAVEREAKLKQIEGGK